MAALVRDTGVITALLPAETPVGAIDIDLHNAYKDGVTDSPPTVSLLPFPGYTDQSPATQKIIREAAASLLFATIAPQPWQTPTFLGAWANEGAPWQVAQYRKEFPDIVRLRGVVQSGSGAIFNLPVGYRPPADIKFFVVGSTTTGASSVLVEASTGNVSLISGSSTQLQLDGICFSVAP